MTTDKLSELISDRIEIEKEIKKESKRLRDEKQTRFKPDWYIYKNWDDNEYVIEYITDVELFDARTSQYSFMKPYKDVNSLFEKEPR